MNTLLLIDKPAGMTSHDVVDRIRRHVGIRQVGHAGTLDPFATGLLIVGVGQATKELTQLIGLDKTYEATAILGATSDTFDCEGKIRILDPVLQRDDRVDRKNIEETLRKFRGGYLQRAPLHSAKKIAGKKLYELARRGLATEDMRPTKQVTISELTLLDFTWPHLRFRVSCSSGTYIRSLADDIGQALGCGAYLEQLRRTRIGPYSIDEAHTLDNLPSF